MTEDLRGLWAINGKAAGPNSSIVRPLAIPEGAQDVEVATEENGALVVRWVGSLYSDSDAPDRWEVTLSPDVRTVHVRVDVPSPVWLGDIEVTIRWVIRYYSGVYVHLCVGMDLQPDVA